MEIVPGIHRIASVYNGRWLYQHLIVSHNRIALIDTGIAETPQKVIFPYIEQIGLSPEQIDVVITTHCDADHCGGNETIRKAAPHALFFSHAKEAELLASTDEIIAKRYGEFQQYEIPQTEENRKALREKLGEGVPMNMSFDSEMSIRFPLGKEDAEFTLKLIFSPGHTAGHLVVQIPERSIFIIADALLGAGVPDTEGQLVLPPTYRYTDEYVQTIQMMKRFKADWYLPTHFHAIRGAENWLSFCDESLQFVEKAEKFILKVIEEKQEASLIDFIHAAGNDRLGEWPEAMDQELKYCLLGGLERLEREQVIEQQGYFWKVK